MQYMLVHAVDDELAAANTWDEAAQASGPSGGCEAPALAAWVDETVTQGVNLHGSRLRPANDATTVKVRRGELILTDGPLRGDEGTSGRLSPARVLRPGRGRGVGE